MVRICTWFDYKKLQKHVSDFCNKTVNIRTLLVRTTKTPNNRMLLIKCNGQIIMSKSKLMEILIIPSFWKVLCCHVEGIAIMFM